MGFDHGKRKKDTGFPWDTQTIDNVCALGVYTGAKVCEPRL